MTVPDAYQSLIEDLLTVTRSGKLSWKPGSNKWTFIVSFEKLSVSVADSADEVGVEFQVALINNEGEEIDSFITRRTDRKFGAVQALWEGAKRNALHIDAAIRELATELDQMKDEEEIPFE